MVAERANEDGRAGATTSAAAIATALAAGVVPPGPVSGLRVGRDRELAAIGSDLDRVGRGGAAVRFVVGPVGAGKTFLLRCALETAVARGFVVARADAGIDRRLAGGGGVVRALLAALLGRMEVPETTAETAQAAEPARPPSRRAARTRTADRDRHGHATPAPGGGLAALLERWADGAGRRRRGRRGRPPGPAAVEASLEPLRGLDGGDDAADVLLAYHRARATGDGAVEVTARRWWAADFAVRSEARRTLGVGRVVGDEDLVGHLGLVSMLARLAGDRGLVVAVDELVVLTHRVHDRASRERTHEAILGIVNACLQGEASGWMMLLGATDECVLDERRGLAAHDGLRSRLGIGAASGARRAGGGGTSAASDPGVTAGPILRLEPPSETLRRALLESTARAIDAASGTRPGRRGGPASSARPRSAGDRVDAFLADRIDGLGADEDVTPRDLVRDFVAWCAGGGPGRSASEPEATRSRERAGGRGRGREAAIGIDERATAARAAPGASDDDLEAFVL